MIQNIFSSNIPLDIALKAFLLLAVAVVGAFCLRNRSAATIHRWWVLGFCGCLAIPAIALIAPTWTLPILPASLSLAETRLTDRTSTFESQSKPTAITRPENASQTRMAPPLPDAGAMPDTPPTLSLSTEGAPLPTSKSPGERLSWAFAWCAFWLAGAMVCLIRRGWQQVLLMRLLHRCTEIGGSVWQHSLEEASSSLGLQSKVTLLKLHEAQSPLTAGLVRSVVILPGDAESWDPARRRLVLLHELAHVKRHDVLTQTVAGLACALYWFNPLCWYGLLQMRKQRELACDDLVLACGQEPADYAEVLLEVARTYRHHTFPTAVGIAHSTNVEKRILAILDKAQSHVSLSRKAARLLLVSATALVLLIGSMRLESQAVPPSSADSAEVASEEFSDKTESVVAEKGGTDTDDNFRTMEVRITDEQGVPIGGAKLYIGVWYTKGYMGEKVPKEYFANSDGIVDVKLPRRLYILRMWPSKPGYVPEFVNFEQGSHDEGRLIPDRYEFQLAKGTRLGGIVVDESGKAVSDVKVDVSVNVPEHAWGLNPKPMISTWLTDDGFNDGSAITDKDGKWHVDDAPAKAGKEDFEFRLKFSHSEYASDGEFGELQKEQGITTKSLRDGTARLVLSRGKPVTGSVVDTSGNPVTDGYVVWRNDPYGDASKFQSRLDESGQFQTSPLLPAEHPFTVIAPGYLPEHRTVNASKEMPELIFVLNPGKHLTVKVVDPERKPIPKAYFYVGSWSKFEPEFNGGQSSVFQNRIPAKADANGIYSWDGAPEEAVTFRISAQGFAAKTVTLVATDREHVVELVPSLIVSGIVTDANSGEPIPTFQVFPVLVNSPQYLTTWFLGGVSGYEGNYEIKLDGISSSVSTRFKLRLEAEGYRTEVSENTFDLSDGRVHEDFSLQPAVARRGMVVKVSGEPVASASVVFATPSIVPSMQNAELEGSWGGRRITTSDDGEFHLAATTEPVRFRVVHHSGFAEVLRQPDEQIGTITVEPWAPVSGNLLQDGKPVPNQSVSFHRLPSGQLGEPRFQDSYYTQTDDQGRFEFERLPPITGSLRAYLGPWEDSPLTSSQSVPLDLKPGEQRTINLGGEGTTIIGQVVDIGRGDAKLSKQWSLNYLISRDRGIELPADFHSWSFDAETGGQPSWLLDPGFHDWLATRENYFVKLAPEGQMQINGVPPGTYDLVLQLYEQPAGCLVETVGEKIITVEVTAADLATGTKDLGTIEVPCRAGPRVGENMQAYKLLDPTGRERTIYDMKGSYVLMHVWASWCAPCLEHMPDMQATLESLSDQPITFVGLNIDNAPAQAQQLAEKNGWNWSQNYLGDDSDIARQLAISSVPTYFLIGPDGLLVATSNEWSEIKEKLHSFVDQD